MSNYLITGGDGFIGSKIVKKTGGRSFDIKTGNSILDKKKCITAARGVEGIFHCAAKISVPESVEFPDAYYDTNVRGFENVLAAAQVNATRVVFSSSAAVYGESSVPVGENASLNPKSPYAENKRDGEELLRASGIKGVALRYFNVYGPGQSPQYAGVITSFIKNALTNKDIVIFGDGTQVRDFIFVDDVTRANVQAMNASEISFDIINIGSGTETRIQDLAETIITLTKSSSKIVHQPSRVGDIVYSCADISKAKSVLRWQPSVTLESGLKNTIEFYRTHGMQEDV